MSGLAVTYLVALGAMLFSLLSAVTLIYAVSHFDPPAAREAPEQVREAMSV